MLWLLVPLAVGILLIWRKPLCPSADTAIQPDLAIIVPARNEESNIERLLASIESQQAAPRRVIVVDDESEDSTAEVARRMGAEVLSSKSLPAGWRGKTWACHQGARAADTEALLFLDADVILKPGAIARIWAAYRDSGVQAMSLGPYHDVQKPYEELSVLFNLMTFIGIGAFSLFSSPRRPRGMFGPCMFIDKQVYDGIGGHEPVKGEILEHMTMAGILAERGHALLCLNGHGVVHIRMYPGGLSDLIEGWTKAFAAGADKTPAWIMFCAVLWISGAIASFSIAVAACFAAFPATAWGLYAAYALCFFWMVRRVGSFSPLTAIFYPIALLFYLVIFTRSSFYSRTHRAVTWKGRSIQD